MPFTASVVGTVAEVTATGFEDGHGVDIVSMGMGAGGSVVYSLYTARFTAAALVGVEKPATAVLVDDGVGAATW